MNYSKDDLYRLNASYGGGWIKNIESTNSTSGKTRFRIVPTGDYTLNNGRLYAIIPTDKILTAEEKRRLNIM